MRDVDDNAPCFRCGGQGLEIKMYAVLCKVCRVIRRYR